MSEVSKLKLTDGNVVDLKDATSRTRIENIEKQIENIEVVDNKNNYSTEEIVVGKWMDGKKLYRKVLTLDISTPEGLNINVESLNISQITLIRGIFNDNQYNYMFPVPSYADGENRFCLFYNKTDKFVHYEGGTSYGINGKLIIVIEYTKTTD